jgi:hypothetical protein
LTTVRHSANVGAMIKYTLTPTESDGNIVAYTFRTESDLWDYVTETLGAEYGMDATDIVGTDAYGYHYTTDTGMCCGHRIATVKASR